MGNIHAICPQCGSTKNFFFRSETWTYEINGNEIPITVKVPYCRKCKIAAVSKSINRTVQNELNLKMKELEKTGSNTEKKRVQRNDEEFFYEKH